MQPEPCFSGAGLDRGDLLRGQPERIDEMAADQAARQLQWLEGFPALDSQGRLSWGEVRDPALFLGLDNGEPRFSSLVPHSPADARAAFPLLASLDPGDAAIFAAALSLTNWHRRHSFCAGCGRPSTIIRGGWSRKCEGCAAEYFPRVDPVVIMLAEHGGRILLGRQPHYPPGRYSALAGFVEAGESIEAAVARELGEEAGIAVAHVTYIASQPWPFPSSLMIGCTARALSDNLTIDTTELDDARWFTRGEVEAAVAGEPGAVFLPPPPYAIARTLLDHWLALEVG